MAHEHVTPEVLARPGSDQSERAGGEGVTRRAFPTLNGDDEESFSAVAVVAEAAAIAVLAGVQLLGRTEGV